MSQTAANKKLVKLLLLGAVAMFGFGFALVPLYDVLCEQLGINGKTNANAAVYEPTVIDTDRLVTIEFISHVQNGMPWEFEPTVTKMQVHPGELIRTSFSAINNGSTHIIGQAVPSVSPGQGAAYFNKTECFCFNKQPLDANSSADLPLIFYVDNALPEHINTLTLSYSLYAITERHLGTARTQGAAR